MSHNADDTLFTLDGTEQSMQHCIEEINYFYMLSGLRSNLIKTEIVWILDWTPKSYRKLFLQTQLVFYEFLRNSLKEGTCEALASMISVMSVT